jgi:hypothetical protein
MIWIQYAVKYEFVIELQAQISPKGAPVPDNNQSNMATCDPDHAANERRFLSLRPSARGDGPS